MSGPGGPGGPGVDGLRGAASGVFRHPDFRGVAWAGVFGSFARGCQHAGSDVDLVVLLRPPAAAEPPPPPDTLFLEDVLPVTWGRPVDIIYVEEGQAALRGYVQLEALLTSRTVFVRDGEARHEVARLRNLSAEVLRQGGLRYRGVVERIRALQSRVAGGSFQAFLKKPEDEKRVITAKIHSLLDDLDIKPRWHPMHEAFWYLGLEDASSLRAKLQSSRPSAGEKQDTESEKQDAESEKQDAESEKQDMESGKQDTESELRVLWDVLTSSDKDSLGKLSRMITRFVLPIIDETQERSRQLEDISTYPPGS